MCEVIFHCSFSLIISDIEHPLYACWSFVYYLCKNVSLRPLFFKELFVVVIVVVEL